MSVIQERTLYLRTDDILTLTLGLDKNTPHTCIRMKIEKGNKIREPMLELVLLLTNILHNLCECLFLLEMQSDVLRAVVNLKTK